GPSSTRTPGRRATRSARRSPEISAAAPATSRSSRRSSWRPSGSGTRPRSRPTRCSVASDPKRGGGPDGGFTVVGKSIRKVDGLAKCAGQTKFADDLVLPRRLFCKIHRAHVPHARIRSIVTTRAAAMPGVVAILTGKDLPIPFGILPVSQDEHALCPDHVRFVGDPVAAVAAVDEDAAFDAMNAI